MCNEARPQSDELKNDELKNNNLFVFSSNGFQCEYLIDKEEIIKHFEIKNCDPKKTIIAHDKKNFFVYNTYDLYQFNLQARKLVKKITLSWLNIIIMTYDGKYLISTDNYKESCTIMSARNQKHINCFNIINDVTMMKCSHDSKYLFFGNKIGFLEIFDLTNFRSVSIIGPFYTHTFKMPILEMVISKDNNSVFFSSKNHYKEISWKINQNSVDFVIKNDECKINLQNSFLINDETNLLVRVMNDVIVQDLKSKKQIKCFGFCNLMKVVLIDDGKKAVVAQKNCILTVIDLQSLQIYKKVKIDQQGNVEGIKLDYDNFINNVITI